MAAQADSTFQLPSSPWRVIMIIGGIIMINLSAIRASLAFAPYLIESLADFLENGAAASRVVRQGGGGLIIRSDGKLLLMHRNREAALTAEDARHYQATLGLRRAVYDPVRLSDEVIIAAVGPTLYLSHPQSDLWVGAETVAALLAAAEGNDSAGAESDGLPEWLSVSASHRRMLLSDQRNGRWVLLGSDHLDDLRRRLPRLAAASPLATQPAPPTLAMKGLTVRLQSAFKLAEALRAYGETGDFAPFAETAPHFSLRVTRATQGMEIRDSANLTAMPAREARKWADIIEAELETRHAMQFERGGVRTVLADGDGGRWALQWGDEVLIPDGLLARLNGPEVALPQASPVAHFDGDFLVVLEPAGGGCVALTRSEAEHL